jgi:3'-phosphoadenosine 5'-phosphosulfate sulfotransferase (PAPS reductase)/FAD synthetase
MTFSEFVKIGQIRSKMLEYKRKKEAAIGISEKILNDSKSPYMAISGGKDSVAMAYIIGEAVKRTGKTVRIWGHVSDASFPGTVETIQEVSTRLSLPLDIYTSEVSAFSVFGKQSKQAFGKTGYFFDSVRNYAKDKDVAFVGVRAAESKRRTKAAYANGRVFYSKSMGDVTVCHPILWYKLEDVAATLWEYDAPIHPIYEKMSLDSGFNCNGEDKFIRLGYATSKDLLTKGTAMFIKVNYPDIFEKLRCAWPEISCYT